MRLIDHSNMQIMTSCVDHDIICRSGTGTGTGTINDITGTGTITDVIDLGRNFSKLSFDFD